jgi:hypothetical protein
MPIDPAIDHEARRVTARAHGALRDQELFDYQRAVWSRDDVVGYDELVDLTEVTQLTITSMSRSRELAALSALADRPDRVSHLAIVAPTDYLFGLARMYATYRGLQDRGTKRTEVFRSLALALDWLQTNPGGALQG